MTGIENGTELAKRAEVAINNSVQAGMKNLHDYLANSYMQNLRPEPGVSSLPNGQDFYRQCLKFHTSTNMTAKAIHQLGLMEVDRIEEKMTEIKDQMNFSNLTLKQFTDMIRSDPANYYSSPEELLARFREIIEDLIDSRLLTVVKSKPELPLEVVPVPPSMGKDVPSAFYITGTADGSRPGRFYVNTYRYESQPKYEMISLSLHESIPGHHLQVRQTSLFTIQNIRSQPMINDNK